MIVITYKNGYQWKYKGDIKLSVSEDILSIDGCCSMQHGNFEWERMSYDDHWLDMIQSIKGNDDDIQSNL